MCMSGRGEKSVYHRKSVFSSEPVGQQRPAGVSILHKLSLVSIFLALLGAGHLEQIPLKLACKLIIGASYEEKWNACKLDFIHFTGGHNSSVGGFTTRGAAWHYLRFLKQVVSYTDVEKMRFPDVSYICRFPMGRGNTRRSHYFWKYQINQLGTQEVVEGRTEIQVTFTVTTLGCGEWLVTLIWLKSARKKWDEVNH